MKATAKAINDVLQLLAQTPQRMAAACIHLDNEQLNFKPDKKSWSANEILAHLRACADVWGKTIQDMLTEDTPTLPHLSPRTWMRKTDYPQLLFQDSFQAFVEQRRELLATLNNLELADWRRGAMIKERKHTVFSQARRMAQHEIGHCEQIEALLESF